MSWRHSDAVGGLLAIALGVVVLAGALTTPDVAFGVVGPAVLPSIFGSLVILSGLWLVVASRWTSAPAAVTLDVRPLALSAVAIAAYFAAFVPLGFVLSSIAFFVGMARILGSRASARDLLAGTAFVVALYALFQMLLTVDLPQGVLPV